MHCVLHIGTEKTGTTLLQRWLYHNARYFSERRVALTKVSGASNNRKLVSYFQNEIDDYLRSNNIRDMAERSDFFSSFEEEFRREISQIESRGATTCIFTSEHFHSRLRNPRQIEELRNFLDQSFDSYSIVCYFREQSKLRTSLYSTALKISSTQEVEEFNQFAEESDHYYNYYSFFKKWEDVFGKASLKPRIFEKDRLIDGDLRLDFIHTAFPDFDTVDLKFDVSSANESLSHRQAELFRAINSQRPRYLNNLVDPTGDAAKEAVLRCEATRKGPSILDSRQQDLYRKFEASNCAFFRHFFGVDENLFKAPDHGCDPGDDIQDRETRYAADVITSIFSEKNIIALTEREIDDLRDLAFRLMDEDAVSPEEARLLLKIANRARPHGGRLLKALDELGRR